GERILNTTEENAKFRVGMAAASLESIRENFWGDACIPKEFFSSRGLNEAHSHSLFLEQFRSRGWVWGAIHLLLWLIAGLSFFRGSDLRSSAYLAAFTAIFVSGLVDHPWFVLN